MNSNYDKPVRNCRRGHKCPPGYTCCSEHVKDGKQKFGLCCKGDSCDPKRGHCRAPNDERMEGYQTFDGPIRTIEGYDDDNCKNWHRAFWVLIVIVVLLAICVFAMATRLKN